MQDYVTPLPLVVLVLVHAACAAAVAAIHMATRPTYPGWRVVGPSGTHWFAILGMWAFGALMGWVWLFVGSGRRDAEFQMNIALLMAIGLPLVGAAAGFYTAALARMALRWRGEIIQWRAGGQEMQQTFANFDAIRRGLDGNFQIRFTDGTILKLDFYARNGEAFLVRFSEELGRDVY